MPNSNDTNTAEAQKNDKELIKPINRIFISFILRDFLGVAPEENMRPRGVHQLPAQLLDLLSAHNGHPLGHLLIGHPSVVVHNVVGH